MHDFEFGQKQEERGLVLYKPSPVTPNTVHCSVLNHVQIIGDLFPMWPAGMVDAHLIFILVLDATSLR